MRRRRVRAAFYRGGTSKGVLFDARDLPQDKAIRDRLFLHVLGSPDRFGRQLNGLGGGLSSLSKVVIVGPSQRADADVDYTFVQIAVDQPVADYAAMCGNMLTCVGPFAVDEGMVPVVRSEEPQEVTVRIHNTNTRKLFHARFPVAGGQPVESGDLAIAGVEGSAAAVALRFLDPAGSATRGLLPAGAPRDSMTLPGRGGFGVSLVDATNPMVFISAEALGLRGQESPGMLEGDKALMATSDAIRRAGAVKMGLADRPEKAALSTPKIAIVSRAADFTALDGTVHRAADYDIALRLISMGRVHRAVTLTGALCLGAAIQIAGSLPHELARRTTRPRIAHPAGILPVEIECGAAPSGAFQLRSVTAQRTQRRIMEGAPFWSRRTC